MYMTIVVIVGLVVGFLTLLHFLFPHIIRLIMRPKFEIRPVIGDLEDVEFNGSKLYASRKVTLSIQNKFKNRPLKLESVAFRRICKYQKQCLLFRYLQKIDAVPNKDWCPCSSVTDWDSSAAGFEQPVIEEIEPFEGKLKLKPAHDIIPKRCWRDFEVPLKLKATKSHIVETTLSFDISLEDIPPVLRVLYRILDPLSKKTGYNHIMTWYMIVDLRKDEDLEARVSKQKKVPDEGFKFACSYPPRQDIFRSMLKSLNMELQRYLGKTYPISEISAAEVDKILKETFPEADIVGLSPPDAKYSCLSNAKVKENLKIWNIFMNFCEEFLDCEQYAFLLMLFTRKLINPFLPRLLICTYKYLVLSSHNPFVDFKVNIPKRTKSLPFVFLKVVIKELQFVVSKLKAKASLKREVYRMAHVVESVKQKQT